MEPDTKGHQSLMKAFGSSIFHADRTLNREALGSIIFSDSEQRRVLESILHPLIWERVTSFQKHCRDRSINNIVEVPLLYENGRERAFSEVWVVTTSPARQRDRLALRNNWTDEEITKRIASQMSLEEKARRADRVLENNSNTDDLRESTLVALSETTNKFDLSK